MLEKLRFLEEAIENAGSEILEEMTLLIEGGEKETIADSVQKIVRDLIESAKNFERFIIEEEEEESFSTEVDFLSDPDDSKFIFKVGDEVLTDKNGLVNPETAYEQFGYPEELERTLVTGNIGFIKARKIIDYFAGPLYVVKSSHDGKSRLFLEHWIEFF